MIKLKRGIQRFSHYSQQDHTNKGREDVEEKALTILSGAFPIDSTLLLERFIYMNSSRACHSKSPVEAKCCIAVINNREKHSENGSIMSAKFHVSALI